jgi:hypothetical protein
MPKGHWADVPGRKRNWNKISKLPPIKYVGYNLFIG